MSGTGAPEPPGGTYKQWTGRLWVLSFGPNAMGGAIRSERGAAGCWQVTAANVPHWPIVDPPGINVDGLFVPPFVMTFFD